MEPALGVPANQQLYLPTTTSTVQSFNRQSSRGPEGSRLYEVFSEDNRSSAVFRVVGHWPSRAVLLDTMGHPLLHATISAGMGYRNISVVTALGQKLVKGWSGVFGGCTLELNGRKYTLKGSTKWKAYGFVAENGESLFGCYEGREAVVVEAGTDPLLAVLLATCVEQMCVSESWRFMLIP